MAHYLLKTFYYNSYLMPFRLYAFCLALAYSALAIGQSFPSEMHLSADGRRLIIGNQETKGFYDESVIHKVNIQFTQSNYWQLLTNNYQSKTNLLAKITIDGVDYDSVGVRFKGQTSYSMNSSQKKSFAVDLDFVRDGQDAKGYESFNFNNCFLDPSYIREVLYLHFNRRHIPAAKANYIHLSLNGQDWGLYNNVQNLDGDFIQEWFLNNKGTRWRAERSSGTGGGPGGGGGFGAGTSSLNYLGKDTNLYKPNYTLKKTYKSNPWQDLATTCDKLYNTPVAVLEDTLKKYLDIDRTLWFLAHEIMFTDDDSYVFKGGMDYWVYWDAATKRLTPLEYDGNTCIDATKATSWSPFYKQTDTKFPLMNKLFPIPGIRQRYLAHVRTILNEDFKQSTVDSLIDGYYAKIDSLVKADPKKIYTYAQFTSSKATLKNFFTTRRTYLLSNAEINRVSPTFSNLWYSSDDQPFTVPKAQETVNVSVKVTGTPGIKTVWLYYATGLEGYFEKLPMYDDGAHDDGAAGDGIWGGALPAYEAGTWVRFYMEAVSSDLAATVAYEPQGAEHDVYAYRVRGEAGSVTGVVINEVMAANTTTKTDPSGDFDDWIELYNNSDQSIDLTGWYLSDNGNDLQKWAFPAGTSIPAKSYLIVWADEDGSQPGLHANFKLSANGETIYLVSPDNTAVQEVSFSSQPDDMGYARVPNGTGSFVVQDPTHEANNSTVSSVSPEVVQATLKIFPNPNPGRFTLAMEGSLDLPSAVYNAQGQLVWQGNLTERLDVDLSDMPPGIYTAKVGAAVRRIVTYR